MRPYALAWWQLTREPTRLFVAMGGVAFAVILMLMQLGFREALFSSSVRFHFGLEGDLFLINPRSSYLAVMETFTRRHLFQTLSFDEVEAVVPVYTRMAAWTNPDTGEAKRIFVVGFDPSKRAMNLQGLDAHLDRLKHPDVLIFDEAARPDYGPVVERLREGGTFLAEVENRSIEVIGLFELGTSIRIDGTVITSDLNFLRLFPTDRKGLIQFGLIQLRPSADPLRAREAIGRVLPGNVEVLTRSQLVRREIDYWASASPIGYIFTLGAIIGFVVGTVIVYQILFSDVSDHLAEYATLKAIGYKDLYLSAVVLFEAVVLAVLGYLPGLAVSHQLYDLTHEATHLPMDLTLEMGWLVFALTVTMCGASGLIAMRKVRSADPAEIF